MGKKEIYGRRNRTQAERLVDIMFSDTGIPVESMSKMRAWLVDSDKADEKEDALYGKFLEMFTFNPEPVLAPQLWPALARRLGMNETPVMATTDPLAPGKTAEVREPEAESETEEPEPAASDKRAGIAGKTKPGRESEAVIERRGVSFRRVALRVAAVLVPVAIAIGAVLWFTGREGDLVEIAVAPGAAQTITLPDGSTVEVEGGSTIAYDGRAFADKRLVTLAGEALFDVAEVTGANGEAAPFTVKSDNLTVNVLGTVFGLATGDGASEASAVSLYEGSVGVRVEPRAEASDVPDTGVEAATEAETVLAVGQRLMVNTATGERTTELIPASEMAERGFMPLLRFDETSLGDLILALEMNYGAGFDVAEGIDRTRGRYTADFEELSLDEVLEMLSKIDVSLSFVRSGDGEMVR